MLSGVEQFKMTLSEFKDAHAAEIKENETMDWYEPKMETFEKFLLEVDLWKTGIRFSDAC